MAWLTITSPTFAMRRHRLDRAASSRLRPRRRTATGALATRMWSVPRLCQAGKLWLSLSSAGQPLMVQLCQNSRMQTFPQWTRAHPKTVCFSTYLCLLQSIRIEKMALELPFWFGSIAVAMLWDTKTNLGVGWAWWLAAAKMVGMVSSMWPLITGWDFL